MLERGLRLILCTAQVTLLFLTISSLEARAAGPIFDQLILLRGVERFDAVPDGANPWTFEACIGGPDLSTSTLPTLQTPPSTNHPSGSTQTMLADDGEYCFTAAYPDSTALIADFPNGNYVVTATNAAGTATDSKQVALSSSNVGAYSDITAPTSGGTVSTTSPTAIQWNLVDVGGCNTGSPSTCLDFYWVYARVNEPGLPDDEVYAELITDPSTAGTSMPAGTFQANTGYQIEVENRRGAIVTETTDTQGTQVTIYKGTADTNVIAVTGAAAAVPTLGAGRWLLLLLFGAAGFIATARRYRDEPLRI